MEQILYMEKKLLILESLVVKELKIVRIVQIFICLLSLKLNIFNIKLRENGNC